MKRGTTDHPKTRRLMRLLKLKLWGACGLLEVLWHFTARHAIRGDIGRWSNEEIAEALGWDGDADTLVNALVEAKWLDASEEHRLIVHDWHEHADESVRKTLRNRSESFLSLRDVSGTFAKVPEESGNGRPQPEPSLARAKPEPPPPPEPSLGPATAGWAAVAVELGELGVGDVGIRPVDKTATPEDCLAIIAYFREQRTRYVAADPLAVLHQRIKSHVHGVGPDKGWSWKPLRRTEALNNNPDHVAMREQIAARQKQRAPPVGTTR